MLKFTGSTRLAHQSSFFFLIKKIGLLMYFLCARTHTYIYKGTQVQTWYNMHMCQVHR